MREKRLTRQALKGLTVTQKRMALILEQVNGIENAQEFVQKIIKDKACYANTNENLQK